MIKNHTHNNDSSSSHYIFKKILELDFIKEAFAFIPLFYKFNIHVLVIDNSC